MEKRKPRIFLLTEADFLLSGFGNYARELVNRLHSTGKYELAELSCYCKPTDEELVNSKWLIYANGPMDENKQEMENYKKNEINQFGLWRFDRALLDFKPDFVLSFRDPWMDQFITESALRDYYYWIWMPTVDSSPQRPYWIEACMKADAVFTYSEFGEETLKRQGRDKINLLGCASPAINPDVFSPVVDKKQHKRSFGLPPDSNIVGTVMRNQKRKLFPDLLQSFRKFLDTAPKEIADKSYIYLHTSYPERNGWDIPELILENKLSTKVFVTYICRNCKNVYADIFHDARNFCSRCGQHTGIMPNVSTGAPTEQLVKIFNLFDVYIQYAICEGYGIPCLEAAACGVPVMAVDWTAMSDVVRYCKGQPIKVQRVFRELETGADRCYPDNDHLADLLVKFFQQPQQIRRQKGFQARQGALARYNWDETSKKWEDAIDNAIFTGRQGKWDSPPIQINTDIKIPELSNAELVDWVYANLTNNPENTCSFKGLMSIRDLNFSANFSYGYLEHFDRGKFIQRTTEIAQHKNMIEQFRTGQTELPKTFFVEMAHRNLAK